MPKLLFTNRNIFNKTEPRYEEKTVNIIGKFRQEVLKDGECEDTRP